MQGVQWSIRSLLNPVITRLLIYGVNPIDVEYVISKVESINHINSKSLEKSWYGEWEKKAQNYLNIALEAEKNNNYNTSRKVFRFVAQCYYACFLINSTDLSEKKRIYNSYSNYYMKSISSNIDQAKKIDIDIGDQKIASILHSPKIIENKIPCIVIYSGLGSCKEEMDIFVESLIEKNIAVLVADMPGNGESLFNRDIKCRYSNIKKSFDAILNTLENIEFININKIGTYGLCMGGGYSYKAASMDSRYKLCVNFFPLLVTQVEQNSTPQWMKKGDWYNYQTGNLSIDDFYTEMRNLEDSTLNCDYLFIHGKYDNWMTLDTAMNFYNKATGNKEKIIVEEVPAFSTAEVVTHSMPVGEQLHWIKFVAADWVENKFNSIK